MIIGDDSKLAEIYKGDYHYNVSNANMALLLS